MGNESTYAPVLMMASGSESASAAPAEAKKKTKKEDAPVTQMEPICSTAVISLKESATLAINQAALNMRASGQSVYHFGFGQSPFPVPQKIQDELARRTGHKEYLPGFGLLELRETICDFYRNHFNYSHFSPDFVAIGPGSKELIFQALYVLEGPVLIPAPSWVSYGPQAHVLGKRTIPIPTQKANRYKLQAAELEEALTGLVDRQKILILNSPCNPTGQVYTREEVKAIAEVCRRNGVIIISDEIYALINFSGEEYSSPAHFYPEGTLVTGGLSKAHSAGGYRLGFLAAHPQMQQFMKALAALISETFSCVSSPIQYAAIQAYTGDTEVMDYVDRCTRIHQVASQYLYKRFIEMGVGCVEPAGGFYLFPDFDAYKEQLKAVEVRTSPHFCEWLLKQHGVAMLPGSDFYYHPEHLSARVASVDYDGEDVYNAALKAPQLDFNFIETHAPNLKRGCDVLQAYLKGLAERA